MAILRKSRVVIKFVVLILAIVIALTRAVPTDVSIVEELVLNFDKSESGRKEAMPSLSSVNQKLHELEEIYVDRVEAFGVLADTTRRCKVSSWLL